MRFVVCAILLVACGDNGGGIDASRPRDAAGDAAIDAVIDARYTCLSGNDCGTGSFCCFNCSPGGACSPDSFCVTPPTNACAHTLCDPMVSGPCTTLSGTTGTCTEVELSMFDHRKVWACK